MKKKIMLIGAILLVGTIANANPNKINGNWGEVESRLTALESNEVKVDDSGNKDLLRLIRNNRDYTSEVSVRSAGKFEKANERMNGIEYEAAVNKQSSFHRTEFNEQLIDANKAMTDEKIVANSNRIDEVETKINNSKNTELLNNVTKVNGRVDKVEKEIVENNKFAHEWTTINAANITNVNRRIDDLNLTDISNIDNRVKVIEKNTMSNNEKIGKVDSNTDFIVSNNKDIAKNSMDIDKNDAFLTIVSEQSNKHKVDSDNKIDSIVNVTRENKKESDRRITENSVKSGSNYKLLMTKTKSLDHHINELNDETNKKINNNLEGIGKNKKDNMANMASIAKVKNKADSTRDMAIINNEATRNNKSTIEQIGDNTDLLMKATASQWIKIDENNSKTDNTNKLAISNSKDIKKNSEDIKTSGDLIAHSFREISKVDDKTKANTEDIKIVKSDVKLNENNISTIKHEITEHATDIKEVKNEIKINKEASQFNGKVIVDVWEIAEENKENISVANGRIDDTSKLATSNNNKIVNAKSKIDFIGGVITANKEYSETNREGLKETWAVAKENESKIDGHSKAIVTNAGSIAANNDLATENNGKISTVNGKVIENTAEIALINDELDTHKIDSAKRDKIITESVAKLKEADKKFAETDKELKEADKKINKNIEKLHKHDEAVYETVGTFRDGSETGVVVKADVNREMIKALQNKATATANDTDKKIVDNSKKITENNNKIIDNSKNINENSNEIANNSQRITNLDNKVNNLQGEMNKGFAMSAAMSTVDFQALEVGEIGIGAGIGNYQNAQAVSLGLGLRATENLSFNVKGAMSTGVKQETMVGAGATYKIRVFGA